MSKNTSLKRNISHSATHQLITSKSIGDKFYVWTIETKDEKIRVLRGFWQSDNVTYIPLGLKNAIKQFALTQPTKNIVVQT